MKRIGIILCFVMLAVAFCGVLSACNSQEQTFVSQDGEWEYARREVDKLDAHYKPIKEGGEALKETVLVLTKYLGNKPNVEIPAAIDGEPVGLLDTGLFLNDRASTDWRNKDVYQNNETLVSVTFELGSQIRAIPNLCFYNCINLESVDLSGITKIGDFAFFGCRKMTAIEVGKDFVSFGEYAFRACNSLKSVTIHATELPLIGNKCFYYIDETLADDEQYQIIDGLSIRVDNMELYTEKNILRMRKENKNYRYWSEYLAKDGVITQCKEA